MGIIDKWHEARGAILRKEFADVMARMRDANPAARSAFLNNVHQTIDRVIGFYSSASVPGRKAFLQKMRKASLRSMEQWRLAHCARFGNFMPQC